MQISSSAIIRHIYINIFDVHQCALSLSKNEVLISYLCLLPILFFPPENMHTDSQTLTLTLA